jgi:hypothetical protein
MSHLKGFIYQQCEILNAALIAAQATVCLFDPVKAISKL